MLFHLIFASCFGQGILERNLAGLSSLSYCDTKNLSKLSVDGVIGHDSTEVIYEKCSTVSYVDLSFTESYLIHYVIVHEGTHNGSIEGGLNYFVVELADHKVDSMPCSMYLGIAIGNHGGRIMRVNCIVEWATKIRIKSRLNKGLSISEVQIFTFIASESDKFLQVYHGCFEDFSSDKQEKLGQWSDCLTMCASDGYTFAAIKNNEECHCGEIPHSSTKLPIAECYMRCGSNFCGGSAGFSVYIVNIQLPHFRGCFEKKDDMGGPTLSGSMSLAKCIKHCYNFTNAAVSDGNDCTCTDNLIVPQFDEYKPCNVKCTGDPVNFCGGKGYRSIYGTKTTETKKNLKWLNVFRCNGGWNEFGRCETDCEPGYLPSYCMAVDTSTFATALMTTTTSTVTVTEQKLITAAAATTAAAVDGDLPAPPKESAAVTTTRTADQTVAPVDGDLPAPPKESATNPAVTLPNVCSTGDKCKDKPNTECLPIKDSYECACIIGYDKQGNDTECSDIDECGFPLCEASSTICSNQIGSYNCSCKPGYFRMTPQVCIRNISEHLFSDSAHNGFSTYFIILIICAFLATAIIVCVMAPPLTDEENDLPTSEVNGPPEE